MGVVGSLENMRVLEPRNHSLKPSFIFGSKEMEREIIGKGALAKLLQWM